MEILGWREPKKSFTISKISAAVRNDNRVNIFLDGKFSFSLNLAQLVEEKLKVGEQIDEERVLKLKECSEWGKLYQRTLEWILIKPRSVKETSDFLEKKRRMREWADKNKQKAGQPFPAEFITDIIAKLSEKGYLNDERFANFYVENRKMKNGISKRRLQMELRQKGLSDEMINRVLNEHSRDERAEIAKMINKKANYQTKKLREYLLRQGFDRDLIQEMTDGRD